MNKNDIRIGDTVEVNFKAKVRGKNGDYANLDVGKTIVALEYYLISNVIARAETDAQKIERLEARVVELEEQNGELAQGQLSRYRQRFPSMAAAWPEQKPEEKPWYPEQLEGYGPWIKGSDLPPETNVYGYMCHVRNGNEIFFCKKLDEEKPWYPKRVKGYGPWIEGQPTEEVRLSSTFQILYKDERRDRKYAHLDYQPGRYFALENAVAYCIKED
jgi:hypothetical protein